MELSDEKTLITNAGDREANFLSVGIRRNSYVGEAGNIKHFKNWKGHSQRIPTTQLVMNAPLKKVIDRMVERGLVIKDHRGLVAQPVLKLVHLPMRDIILHYRQMLNGVLNYYSFVDNRPRLGKVY